MAYDSAGRGKVDKTETYVQSIRDAYPDFRIRSAELNEAGQYNNVLIVNEQFTFRFPKVLTALERLGTETSILTGIQNYVSLDVPDPTFVCLGENTIGGAFVGYQMIPGEPLWRQTFRAIGDDETLATLATQLSTFLGELHHVSCGEAIGCELPAFDSREQCVDIYTRIQHKLFTFMSPDAREWAMSHFETFLNNARNFSFAPVLKHGDFGPSNILFDGGARRITGIIDFGGSGLGDPAYDFAGLLSGYGEDFVKRCARTYPEVESFWDRILFYRGTFALLEALFGVENDDEEAFRDGISTYV